MASEHKQPKRLAASFDVAPLDSYAQRISNAIAMIGGVLMLPALFWFLSGIGSAFSTVVIPVAVALALVVWLILTYAVQPTAYRIEGDQLLIPRRWWRALRIPLHDVMGVSVASALADVPRAGLRRAFNAGVFGYHGLFQLDPYGTVFFSATNRERLVAVARRDRPPLIVSPERPRDFVEALREALIQRTEAYEDALSSS
ncbi:MAG TPA: PH domain-containing protein [Roseiflexaceae bacterium]|nr:PH domain-containing protein [Roseiflexaceae bacterium]